MCRESSVKIYVSTPIKSFLYAFYARSKVLVFSVLLGDERGILWNISGGLS